MNHNLILAAEKIYGPFTFVFVLGFTISKEQKGGEKPKKPGIRKTMPGFYFIQGERVPKMRLLGNSAFLRGPLNRKLNKDALMETQKRRKR